MREMHVPTVHGNREITSGEIAQLFGHIYRREMHVSTLYGESDRTLFPQCMKKNVRDCIAVKLH